MEFVDTSARFAYFLPNDPNHLRVRDCLQSRREQFLTTDYCVDEILTLLLARGEVRRALEAGDALFEEGIAELHFITAHEINRAWILFKQHAQAGWSFTDCTSKVVIDELKIARAVALDAHFRQFGIDVVP
jgi:uncharacterized protein